MKIWNLRDKYGLKVDIYKFLKQMLPVKLNALKMNINNGK